MYWRVLVCFFFSSRRRHTRSLRDWSSDVCSSDLEGGVAAAEDHATADLHAIGEIDFMSGRDDAAVAEEKYRIDLVDDFRIGRSEERRVGKECRSRWSRYD